MAGLVRAYSNHTRLPDLCRKIIEAAAQRPDQGPSDPVVLSPLAKVWTEDDIAQAAA
jgi:hypothetical protein